MKRNHILIAAGGVLALATAAAIGMRSYRIQRSIVAWRVRHNLSVQLAGIKFHVPPGLAFYESRHETQGTWRFIRRDGSSDGSALYVIETNNHRAPELKSSSSSMGSRRFVKTLPVVLAGKNGLCAEFDERVEWDVAGPFDPHFISVDCSFGPQLGVTFFGRPKGVEEFYRFIQTAE
jgi:hypothetical protein